MKPLHLVLILSCILFSLPALAELEPKNQGEVTFVSGGVGGDEQEAMQAMRADYNLSLLFSMKGSGDYLSDVKVNIADSSHNTLVDAVSDGPMFFAKLKPGHYLITVDQNGQVIHKTVTVRSKQSPTLSFTWAEEQGN
jgi:hypothetical protein